jgi:DNA-binding NarL/FixJ family response regulator
VALRVALVDDHRLMREGLRELLSRHGVDVIGEGSNGHDAVRLARELRPDVVLMDLSMPGMNGLEATRLIQAERPEQVVVILTASEAESDLFDAVRSGALGYLLKSHDPEQFVPCLEAAARGEATLTPTLASKILRELARSGGATGPADPLPTESVASTAGADAAPNLATAGVEPLTPRERDVLDLVVRGLANREIAESLVVSENTVKYHLKNILQKLHLRNRAEVVAFALRHGMDAAPGF